MIRFLIASYHLQASEVYNEAGIRGFWKGIIPTLVMVTHVFNLVKNSLFIDGNFQANCTNSYLKVCNPSIQFMIYETSVKQLQSKRSSIKNQPNDKKLSALEVLILYS
jgi:solute carrier family 25 (peroxisomal adenine nucleotide transporter), member 17